MQSEEEDDDDDFLRAVAKAPDVQPRAPETSLERIAQFRIVEKIGRGGMGIVYRAEDEKLGRVVALKVLPEDFDDDPSRKRRFMREARLAASLAHPNVAAVHEVGEADGRIYIAMELVEGRTLRRVLDGGPLAIAEALRIARETARGVAPAHARGIAHRDLKPDNVMVSEGGAVKVLDFGLAKPVDVDRAKVETASFTQEGRILGTPGYMSPEQATGRAVDVRTDVFSLGVMLYEMLTGKRPFEGDTSMEILMATSRDRYVPVAKIAPKVAPAVIAVVDRCLAKNPEDRYASAAPLLAALESVDTREARAASRTVRIALAVPAVALLAFAASRIAATDPPVHAEPPPPSAAPAITAVTTIAPSASSPPAASSAAPPPAASSAPSFVKPRPVAIASAPARAKPASAAPVVSASSAPPPPPTSTTGVIEKSPY